MEDNANMFGNVLETYRCLLSCRKKMPGMRLEEALNDAAIAGIESEYEWLLSQQKNWSVKSSEKALDIYKKELEDYKNWSDEKKKFYGKNTSPIESWDTHDYNKITNWNSCIAAMEKVLGLTEEEVKKYCTEIGMLNDFQKGLL